MRFFLGHAYYLNSEYDKAVPYFEEIIGRDESSWVEEAEWGLLACWYKTKTNQTEFDSLLHRIAEDNGHSFHREAVELLRSEE